MGYWQVIQCLCLQHPSFCPTCHTSLCQRKFCAETHARPSVEGSHPCPQGWSPICEIKRGFNCFLFLIHTKMYRCHQRSGPENWVKSNAVIPLAENVTADELLSHPSSHLTRCLSGPQFPLPKKHRHSWYSLNFSFFFSPCIRHCSEQLQILNHFKNLNLTR